MYTTKTQIFLLLALTLFCLRMSVSSAGEKDTPRGEDFSGVHFRDGHLRVSVENQKFQKVMDEVAQKAGIEIVINHTADEDLTIDFDYLPLEKGLKKLLRGSNYMFIYRSGEVPRSVRLVQVLVLPKPEGWTMAGPVGIIENRPANQIKQNIDQQRLDDVLKGFSQNNVDLRKQFYEALEKIQEMDVYREMKRLEGEVLQGLSQSGVLYPIKKETSNASEGIQDIEKVLKETIQNQILQIQNKIPIN